MGGWSGIAEAIDSNIQQHKQNERADEVKLRERQADDIEKAIEGIQARTDLSPAEKAGQIDAARAQLQKLYKPHEANSLFERLERVFKKDKTGGGGATSINLPGAPEFKVGDTAVPGTPSTNLELKPGLTIAEVLAAGSPQAKPPAIISKTPTQGSDGKWYVIQQDAQGNVTPKEIPGYSEQTLQESLKAQGYTDEQIKSYMDIQAGVKAKPVAKSKGLKYEASTDEVVDGDTGQRYTRDGKDNPEEVNQMFAGAKRVQKHKEDIAVQRFHERLQMQQNGIAAAVEKGEYARADQQVAKAKSDLIAARRRLYTMQRNLEEITANPANQQAMLSLVANHIGMTLGQQRGARITRAVWEEAIGSTALGQRLQAKFVWQTDPTTHLPIEILQDVYISPEQAQQMVGLGEGMVGDMERSLEDVNNNFGDVLAEGEALKHPGNKPNAKKATVHFTEGNDHWDIPQDKVAAFKIKHPNAKEQ